MKNLIFIFLFLITIYGLNAKENFLVYNLKIDYSGVCYFNNKIIAYGNSGDFVISNDKGQNWFREHIFTDTLGIVKMYDYKNHLFVATTKGVLYKLDENFKIVEMSNKYDGKYITSFTKFSDSLFAITSVNNNLFVFDDNLKIYKEFTIGYMKGNLIKNLYKGKKYDIVAANDKLIILYDKEKSLFKNIDIDKFNYGEKIEYVKLINNEFYIKIDDNIYKLDEENLKLVLLVEYFTDGFIDYANGFMYKIIRSDQSSALGTISFSQLISGGFKQRCILNYKRYITNNFEITDAIVIDSKTYVAVGTNNTIAISNDYGFNWDFISYFSPFYTLKWVNEKIGYYTSTHGEIFKTLDGGATFLPQNNQDTNLIRISTMYPILFNMNEQGIGHCWSGYNPNGSDSSEQYNFLITRDFGNTYEKKWIDGILPRFSIGKYDESGYSTIKVNDKIVHNLVRELTVHTKLVFIEPEELNKDQYNIQSTDIDSSLIYLINSDNHKTWAYIIQGKHCFIGSSIDPDLQYWQKELALPDLRGDSNKSNFVKNNFFRSFTDNPFSNHFVISLEDSSYILSPTVDIFTGQIIKGDTKVYTEYSSYYINLNEKIVKLVYKDTLDYEGLVTGNYFGEVKLSIKPGSVKTRVSLPFLFLDSILYNYTFYAGEFAKKGASRCDLHNINEGTWRTEFIPIELSDFKTYEKKSVLSFPKINFQKISDTKYVSESLILELSETINKVKEIEKKNVYMYKYHPYPQPASNYVKIKIYTNNLDCFNPDDFSLFNSDGVMMNSTNQFTIEQTGIYEAEIKWDCSGYSAGVYLIKLNCESYNDVIKVIKN